MGVISKQDFLKHFKREKITIWFDEHQFMVANDVMIKARRVILAECGNYYCPWYYDVETEEEYTIGFEEILQRPHARAVKIKAARTKIKRNEETIQQYIKDFQGKTGESLCPFPVATDTVINKTLVLDGNKTLVALWESWSRDKEIPVLGVKGPLLIRIFPDFRVVYKS